MYIHWSEQQKRLVAYVAELRNYLVREMQVINLHVHVCMHVHVCELVHFIYVPLFLLRKNYNHCVGHHSLLILVRYVHTVHAHPVLLHTRYSYCT